MSNYRLARVFNVRIYFRKNEIAIPNRNSVKLVSLKENDIVITKDHFHDGYYFIVPLREYLTGEISIRTLKKKNTKGFAEIFKTNLDFENITPDD